MTLVTEIFCLSCRSTNTCTYILAAAGVHEYPLVTKKNPKLQITQHPHPKSISHHLNPDFDPTPTTATFHVSAPVVQVLANKMT
jgi:hypothetical protein